jgi:subtilase family serine protease
MTSPTRPSALASIFAALTALVLCLAPAAAQNRIAQAVTSTAPRVALTHTVSPRALAAVDLGAAPADRTLSSVTLRFNMSSAQSAALDTLLAAQQNPQSPLYHQWLTPDQYAAQFGLSAADIAKVTAWLQSQGLTVTGVARGRTFVTVSGTVAQLNAAFNASIHSISLNGVQHIANLTEPSLPASIAAVTGSITGLSDIHLKPRLHPRFTSSITGNHYIAPGDIYTIYDINPLLTSSINGSGVTIAVAGQTDISQADVAAFRSASGLTANAPTVKLIGTDPGVPLDSQGVAEDQVEASIDVEWSGAVAPAATILYVNSTDVLAGSLTQIIDQDLAPIATVSYGDCESGTGSSVIASFNALFRQAAAQGQSIAGPAGDTGATDCDYDSTVATQGLAVDFPASSPYVTAVGGTMFNEGTGTYFNTTNGNYSGSAISYIPELPWNETGLGGGLGAGGGGASAYFTKPTWQVGTGVPADSSRDVPDLAFNAAASHDGYLICQGGFCTNGFRNAASGLDVYGGTSVATPEFAGMLALLEQKLQTKVGLVNPTLYALANSTYATNVFHDVTSGNNDSPCTLGTLNCTTIVATCDGVSNLGTSNTGAAVQQGCIGFNAGVGYDQTTGWGSLNVFNFVNDWSLVTPLSVGTNGNNVSATTLTGASATVTAGASIALTANVASATSGFTTTPTGTVQLLVDNVAVGSPVALTSGSASFNYSTSSLSSGAHAFTAAYSGDTNYAGSKGIFNLDVVSASAADFTLSPSTGTLTTTPGGTTPGLTFTLTPANGFTGAVNLTASTNANLNGEYSFSVDPVTVSSTAGVSTVFTLSAYASDAVSSSGLHKLGSGSASNHLPSLEPSGSRGWEVPATGIALAGLLFLAFPKRRSRWTALVLALASVGILGASGCSSGVSTASNTSGTINAAAGTYTITVTATGTNAAGIALSHNATVTFVVQ